MAEVFKAATYGVESFERFVAIKRVLPSIAQDQEFIDMFVDEAKIAVQLAHSNIGKVFELGQVGDATSSRWSSYLAEIPERSLTEFGPEASDSTSPCVATS